MSAAAADLSTDVEATAPVGVVARGTARNDWLAARARGLGASDVAAALGFSRRRTPWQVWAEKVDARRPADRPSTAAYLGVSLEPWLREQAAILIGLPVLPTPFLMYGHPVDRWQLASPDGWVDPDHLVELKTAGLAVGWGVPDQWSDEQAPLGYELQCRWQMRVLDAARVDLVALVAGLGLRRYSYQRDLGIEADLVAQVAQWWHRHVIDGVEPPLAAGDNDILRQLYPHALDDAVNLDGTDALEHAAVYRRALAAEKAAVAAKDQAAAALKALLGSHDTGRWDDRVLCTWKSKLGTVDWAALAKDLAEQAGIDLPDPDKFRRPPSRVLSVKELT